MYNIVCNTNTTTNANEIKALTRVESEQFANNLQRLLLLENQNAYLYFIFLKQIRTVS